MNYSERQGDLIALAKKGQFDVIAHGCNCFCTMGAGIAPQMAHSFNCDNYELENELQVGNINKLGCIEYKGFDLYDKGERLPSKTLYVVNAYTQYSVKSTYNKVPLDYQALTLCLRKMNNLFKGLHIGLPQIGCGLAGGDWAKVKEIITSELKDCRVTVIIYSK